jgi:hypothetical protein
MTRLLLATLLCLALAGCPAPVLQNCTVTDVRGSTFQGDVTVGATQVRVYSTAYDVRLAHDAVARIDHTTRRTP